jgi:hypothetical protein
MQNNVTPPTDDGKNSVYVPRDIKPERYRRTQKEMTAIRAAITDLLSKDNPQTVRQVFYALTVRGVITKDEVEYKRTVVRLLGEMREAGEIPFEWLADNTRWMRKSTSFTGLEACLNATSSLYRRNLWAARLRRGVVREGRSGWSAAPGNRCVRCTANDGEGVQLHVLRI